MIIPQQGKCLFNKRAMQVMGVLAAVEAQLEQAERYVSRMVALVAEWLAAHPSLGVFNYETG